MTPQSNGTSTLSGMASTMPDDSGDRQTPTFFFAFDPVQEARARGGAVTADRNPSRVSEVKAEINKTAGDRVFTDADLFGDGADAKAIKAHGFNSLQRKRQTVVLAHVGTALHDQQILKAIIEAVPVDVMNVLIGRKFSPKEPLHDPSVLAHRLTVARDVPVGKHICRFINALATIFKGRFAGRFAEKSSLSGRVPPSASKSDAAVCADNEGPLFHIGSVGNQKFAVQINPSAAQIKAGNYQKGAIKMLGFDISIETPKGAARRGVGADGEPWENRHHNAHYGYLKGHAGKAMDGEEIDVYVGPHRGSRRIFVVDQVEPKSRKPDEHKVILGAQNITQAKRIYDEGFSDGSGSKRRAAVHETTPEALKEWLKSGNTKTPFADHVMTESSKRAA